MVSELNGKQIAILSGANLTLEAARLTAEREITMQADGELTLMAATELNQSHHLHPPGSE